MSTAITEELDLSTLNELFEQRSPLEVVKWSAAEFGRDLVMTSSFGAESAALIHMAIQHLPDIRIIFINTGYLFPETHAFMESLRQRFSLNVWTYHTRNDPIAWLRSAGEDNPAERKNVDACCAANKNEPMDRAMRELQPRAWLRGIRRNQAVTREAAQFVERWQQRYNCYVISPLLNWTSRDFYNYMKQHDLPYHPLYEKGYTSIGCNPRTCTTVIQIGADPRSGRWVGKAKFECGINVENSLDSANL
jgi:phosphoadenosine phosphosulfate reductase